MMAIASSLSLVAQTPTEKTLTVYSARNEQLIKPLFDAYTKETGVKIQFLTDKEGPLLQKLKAEGVNSPADLLLTVDAGNLWLAEHEGVLASIQSPVLEKNIPKHLRSPKNSWFGLSVRARTIFYNKDLVKPADLTTYEDLAGAKFAKKLCLRTSQKVYNQSLVAMLISHHGEKKAESIVKGWVSNLKTEVFPDDTKLLEAIDLGLCEVGIANTYYYGRLLEKNPKLKVGIFWPNQKNTGVHVNVSGVGVVTHSKNKEEAIKFIEWMSSEKGQNFFADVNLEFPVNKNVKSHELVQTWGAFKQDMLNVSKAGELQSAAVKLMDKVQYK